jgi:hypothetical protein
MNGPSTLLVLMEGMLLAVGWLVSAVYEEPPQALQASPSGGSRSVEFAPGSSPPPTAANVAYGPHERQVLEFWQTPAHGRSSLILYIHSRSWLNGIKSELTRYSFGGDIARCLAAGISAASIDCRYVSEAYSAIVQPPVEWPLPSSI